MAYKKIHIFIIFLLCLIFNSCAHLSFTHKIKFINSDLSLEKSSLVSNNLMAQGKIIDFTKAYKGGKLNLSNAIILEYDSKTTGWTEENNVFHIALIKKDTLIPEANYMFIQLESIGDNLYNAIVAVRIKWKIYCMVENETTPVKVIYDNVNNIIDVSFDGVFINSDDLDDMLDIKGKLLGIIKGD